MFKSSSILACLARFGRVRRGSDEAASLWQLAIHPFGQKIQVPDEATDCCWKNLHPSWQVWQGPNEAASLWQLAIHPFGQKMQVSDEAAICC